MNETLTIDAIAHVVHEANRALQVEQADPTIPVSPLWEDLDEETKESARDGVKGVLSGNDAKQSHDNWVEFKVKNGWTIGPVKDTEKKQHPLLVPYEDLPESQRLKDDLFNAIVLALGKGGIDIPLINEKKTNKQFREGAGR